MNMKDKFFFQCVNCNAEYPGHQVLYLCPKCSSLDSQQPPKGVLKVLYHYNEMSKSGMDFRTLDQKGFVDLLPITELSFFPNLRIGNTPLYKIDGTSGNSFPFDLYLKDDSQNPTFSLKDRASALVSAYAREKQLNVIVAASTGNAGSSIAGICASQGQRSVVLVPASAPAAKLTQMIMYGAVVDRKSVV